MLRSAADSGSLSHAYILESADPENRMEAAQELALTLFCEKRKAGETPCLSCGGCRKVLSGNHPDILYLKHEKDTIGVSEVREQVVDTVDIIPYYGGRKLYILDDADHMTVQAQNSLLKTLEEPPEYAVLLLLCSDHRVLCDTILSRAMLLSFRNEGKTREDPEITEKVKAFLSGIRDADAAALQTFAREMAKEQGAETVFALASTVRDLLLEQAENRTDHRRAEGLLRLSGSCEKAEKRLQAALPAEQVLLSLLLSARDVFKE